LMYKETVSIPIPGSNLRSLGSIVEFRILTWAIVIFLAFGWSLILFWILLASEAKLVISILAALGLMVLVHSDMESREWCYSAIPIVLYDKGIAMPVLALERILLHKPSFVPTDEIQAVRIVERGKETDRNRVLLEMVIETKDGGRYRSRSKLESEVRRIEEVIREKWPRVLIG